VTLVVGQTRIGALAGGQIRYRDAIEFTVPTQPGQYRLRAKIDSDNRVAESSESNNWGPMITLQVDAAHLYADLLAVFPDSNDITVRPGQAFEFPGDPKPRISQCDPQGVNYFDTELAHRPIRRRIGMRRRSVRTDCIFWILWNGERFRWRDLAGSGRAYWLRADGQNGAVVEGNEDNWSSAIGWREWATGGQHPPLLTRSAIGRWENSNCG
jgi:hypothetical protein